MYSCCYECGSTLECCVFSRLGVHWIADLILEVHCSAVIMRVQMHWSAVYSADWECIGMLCIQQTGSALDCCVFSGLGVHWISGLIVEVHCTAVIRRLPVHWVCWCFCGSALYSCYQETASALGLLVFLWKLFSSFGHESWIVKRM